jgi:hypothetical protein
VKTVSEMARGFNFASRHVLLFAVFLLYFLPQNADSIRRAYRMDDEDVGIDFLGSWATNRSKISEYRDLFINAQPFPYVVIDDFFAPKVASRIESRFPVPNGSAASEWIGQGWHVSSQESFFLLLQDADAIFRWELDDFRSMITLSRVSLPMIM